MSLGSYNKKSLGMSLIYIVIFVVLFTIFGYANFTLFYRQAHCNEFMVGDDARYQSDIPDYIDVVKGVDTEFEFSYPLLFDFSNALTRFLSPEDAVAVAVLILNMICIPVLTLFFKKSLVDDNNPISVIGSLIMPYVIMLVSMLWVPGGNEAYGLDFRYLGVFTPNPWHNQTYFAARPFAIVAFLFFGRILSYYEDSVNLKDYIVFSLFLVFSTMAKPSFTFVFISAAAVYILIRLIFHKFATLRNTLYLGICFAPTIIVLAMQYLSTFSNEQSQVEEGIGFGFLRVWSMYSGNVTLSLVLVLVFPIIVLVFNFKLLFENRAYRFGWEFFLAGMLEFMFLTEEGDRLGHANFSWGYMYGLFFVFLVSAWLLFKNTVSRKNHISILLIQWLGLVLHFVAGSIYFVYLLQGGDFTQF